MMVNLKECISLLHGKVVHILEKSDKLTEDKIKEFLPSLEIKMNRRQVSLHSQREKNLSDFLDEYWILPSCEWIDNTDFWPRLPPLFNKSATKNFNLEENMFWSCSIEQPCHPFTKSFFSIPYNLTNQSIDQLFSFSEEFAFTPNNRMNVLHSKSAPHLPHLNDYLNKSLFTILNKPLQHNFNTECGKVVNDLVNSVCSVASCKYPPLFSCTHPPICTLQEISNSCQCVELLPSKVFSIPSVVKFPFPLWSSVCFSPSFHCSLEQLLLDFLELLASLSSNWCVAKEFGDSHSLELIKFALQYDNLQIREVACKLVAGLSQHEPFIATAVRTGLLQQVEKMFKINEFSVKLSANRALHNIWSSNYLKNAKDLQSADHILRTKECLSFMNEDGSLPFYSEGVYPCPESKNVHKVKSNPCEHSEGCDNNILSSNDKRSVEQSLDEAKAVDIVLIHGVKGGASWTWRQHDSFRAQSTYSWCWPKDWLTEDLPNTPLRVISVNYPEPGVLSEMRTLSSQSEKLKTSLLKAGVGQRPVLWITHSRGGLLLKSIFRSIDFSDEKSPDMKLVARTVGVVFLSTPHVGCLLAPLVGALSPSVPELKELGYNNKKLIDLNENFESIFYKFHFRVVSLIDKRSDSVFGANFKIVPPLSANPGYGEVIEVDQSHLDICKPKNRTSAVYNVVHDLLTMRLQLSQKNSNSITRLTLPADGD